MQIFCLDSSKQFVGAGIEKMCQLIWYVIRRTIYLLKDFQARNVLIQAATAKNAVLDQEADAGLRRSLELLRRLKDRIASLGDAAAAEKPPAEPQAGEATTQAAEVTPTEAAAGDTAAAEKPPADPQAAEATPAAPAPAEANSSASAHLQLKFRHPPKRSPRVALPFDEVIRTALCGREQVSPPVPPPAVTEAEIVNLQSEKGEKRVRFEDDGGGVTCFLEKDEDTTRHSDSCCIETSPQNRSKKVPAAAAASSSGSSSSNSTGPEVIGGA